MVAYFCHLLSDNYVDLSDNYVHLLDLYVDLSVIYVNLSEHYLCRLVKNKSSATSSVITETLAADL